MRKWILPFLIMLASSAHAAEGMWTLDNLPSQQLQSLYGFTPAPEWIDKVMHASVRLAGGCSGSFISPGGLVMTNHHCARQCVEQISSAKKNYAADGFLAHTMQEEVPCPDIELNRLEQITDVTAQVKQATAGLQGAAYKEARNAVEAKLTSACTGKNKDTVRCDVVDLYHGGRYHLYRYHRFQDARLVWAPEETTAFFGGDPDNFNFPRYDLDVAFLRAYENGKPAATKDYFRFNPAGAKEGELTFVTGHPGRTQRKLTVSQFETLRDVILLNRLLQLAEARGMLTEYGKSGAEAARVSQNDLFGVENSYKALYGQLQTLLDPRLMAKKREGEERLKRYVAAHPELDATTGGAWDAIAKVQAVYRDIATRYNVEEAGRGFYSKYFGFARTLVRGAEERAKPDGERLPEYADARLPEVEQHLFSAAPVYPDFEETTLAWSLTKMREWLGADDPFVKKVLGKRSPGEVAADMIGKTRLADPAVRKALWRGGREAIEKSDDPFIRLARLVDPDARTIRKRMEDQVEAVDRKNSELIAQARFAQYGTSVYPDATFTLRLSYGEVKGWTDGGVTVPPFTMLRGAFERNTGADPFALPESWLDAKNKLDLDQRLDFVMTNDVIGGNSGSPVINRDAEAVGLVFDGNIHSLGGAFWYDESLNRTVAVHTGAILEALNKIYGATRLTKEITGP